MMPDILGSMVHSPLDRCWRFLSEPRGRGSSMMIRYLQTEANGNNADVWHATVHNTAAQDNSRDDSVGSGEGAGLRRGTNEMLAPLLQTTTSCSCAGAVRIFSGGRSACGTHGLQWLALDEGASRRTYDNSVVRVVDWPGLRQVRGRTYIIASHTSVKRHEHLLPLQPDLLDDADDRMAQ